MTVSVGLALLAAVPLAPDTVLVFTVHHGDEHGQEARSIAHVAATATGRRPLRPGSLGSPLAR